MENKMLSIQKFYRNQNLISSVNNLLVYYKLKHKQIDSRIEEDKISIDKKSVIDFLKSLEILVESIENNSTKPLTGTDERMRSFAKKFVAAKRKKNKFRSFLFNNDISELEKLILTEELLSSEKVLESLKELNTLLEEESSLNFREITGEI
jgi:hypothetical protein